MALTKILITVKTYPTLSAKYDELVCTAGFREDGSWIRIYPVPFRKLDYQNQYHKWQWIEMDIVKNTRDFRPESFRPANIDKGFTVGEKIETTNNWYYRKPFALKKVYTNMSTLIAEAKDKKVGISLATFKPARIIDFIYEPCAREWDKKKLDAVKSNNAQHNLFEETKRLFQVVKKIPYKFSYVFTCEEGKKRTLMIEDWELGQLYWNCLQSSNGDEAIACQKVRAVYFDKFVSKCDLYFFLGTTQVYHNVGPNPFIIIGTFYPLKEDNSQLSISFE